MKTNWQTLMFFWIILLLFIQMVLLMRYLNVRLERIEMLIQQSSWGGSFEGTR